MNNTEPGNIHGAEGDVAATDGIHLVYSVVLSGKQFLTTTVE